MPTERILSDLEKAELIRRYKDLENVKTLASAFGFQTSASIYKRLRDWGIPHNRPDLRYTHCSTRRKKTLNGKRQCASCLHWKLPSEFSKSRHISDGLDTKCRACKKETNAANKSLRYGLTKEQYAELLALQKGVCASCGQPETHRYHGKQIKALAVDHDHTTGAVRGLLCADCNIAEGHLKTPEKVLALYNYLRKHGVQ